MPKTTSTSTQAPALESFIGTVIAQRYRVVRLLGEGGFAWVFEGVHLSLNHKVAIKLLKPRADKDQHALAHQRFLREAQLVANLEHPDLIRIHDHGTTPQGIPFIVMEFLQGYTLSKELWLHGAMQPERAVRLMIRCLSALGVAHQNGVIHRDLKPDNLFLIQPGEPYEALKVLDFGIAFFFDEQLGRLTRTGEFMGTPEYLSPEVIQHSEHVTPAIDVYQMGLILIEMLTGHRLLDFDDPMKCLFAHCNGHVQVPYMLSQSPLGDVLARAIAQDPKERYQHAMEFCQALQSLQSRSLTDLSPMPTTQPLSSTAVWSSDAFSLWADNITSFWNKQQQSAPVSASFVHDLHTPQSVVLRPDESTMTSVDKPGKALGRTVLGALLVLLLASGLVWVLLNKDNAPVSQPQTATLPVTKATSTPPPQSASPAQPLVLSIETSPPGAYVFDGTLLLGQTPMGFPQPTKATTLDVRLSGYQTHTLHVTPQDTQIPSVNLEPLPKVTKAPVVKKPAARAPQAKPPRKVTPPPPAATPKKEEALSSDPFEDFE